VKKIAFDKPERDALVDRIQRYFVDELDQEIGVIPAQFLLDFFTDEIGGFYYNQGLADAQAVFAKSLDEVNDRIYGLEQRDTRAR
jgi:uncharacterized protein (DUF2164 family)